jgi:rubrerythrin
MDSTDHNQERENKLFEEEYNKMTLDERMKFINDNLKECINCGVNFISKEPMALCPKCRKDIKPRKSFRTFNNSDDFDYDEHEAFCNDMRKQFEKHEI